MSFPSFPPRRAKPVSLQTPNLKQAMLNLIASKIRPFLVRYTSILSGLALICTGLATGFGDLAALAVGEPLDFERLQLAGTQIVGGVGLLFAGARAAK